MRIAGESWTEAAGDAALLLLLTTDCCSLCGTDRTGKRALSEREGAVATTRRRPFLSQVVHHLTQRTRTFQPELSMQCTPSSLTPQPLHPMHHPFRIILTTDRWTCSPLTTSRFHETIPFPL